MRDPPGENRRAAHDAAEQPPPTQPAACPPRRPLPIAVLISGGGSTLANLLAQRAAGRLPGVEIKLVISSRADVGGIAIACAAGLPLEVVAPRNFATPTAFSEAVAAALDRAGVELVVMGGYLALWLYPPRFERRVINIHPALLPAFGGKGMFGRHVHAAVLASGARESGCTVHWVDHEYDHGPILAQQRVPVLPNDTPETLGARVQAAERELYPRVILDLARQMGTAPR